MSQESIEYINGIKIINIIQGEFDMASAEIRQQRLDICNSCDKKMEDTCSECSCLLSVRTSYQEITCPIGKW